jgi:hypothetical protein
MRRSLGLRSCKINIFATFGVAIDGILPSGDGIHVVDTFCTGWRWRGKDEQQGFLRTPPPGYF